MPVTRSTSSRACAPVAREAIESRPVEDAPVQDPPPAATTESEVTGTTSTETDITGTTATTSATEATTKKTKSTKSKRESKKLRLARAKEEMIELQVKLASARVATLEAEIEEDTEDSDADTVLSEQDTTRRVGNWLNESQPHVPVLTDKPHVTEVIDETPTLRPATRIESPVPPTAPPRRTSPARAASPMTVENKLKKEESNRTSAAQQVNLSELASAIALAAKSGTRPRFMADLPTFAGMHQDWLTFKAAYDESSSSFTETENIARLRRTLKGRAREAVDNLLMYSARTEDIMKALENRFGRPDCIALAELERMRALPRLTDNAKDVCIFASRVSNIVATLQALKRTHYLYNPEITKITVERLTPTLRYRWFDFATEQQQEEPDLVKLSRFLNREADRCSPYAPPETSVTEHHSSNRRQPAKTYNTYEKPDKYNKCTVCSSAGHDVTKCDRFVNVTTNERWDLAKEHKLCFTCLRYRNKNHTCKRRRCDIDGCRYTHHALLHHKRNDQEEEVPEKQTVASTWTRKSFTSYLKIVPVHVSGPAGAIDTFALLDDGSTVTLVDAEIARQTGANGPREALRIEAIGDCEVKSSQSRRVDLSLRGPSDRAFHIQARTIENMCLSAQVIHEKDVDECDHLRDVREELRYEQAEPRILIGQDNWHLLLPTEVRVGRRDQPVASRTALGWVLHGASSRTLNQQTHTVNYVSTEDSRMDERLRDYIALDTLFIEPKLPRCDPDQRAIEKLRSDVRVVNGTYEAPLLWRDNNIVMPDNYDNTLKRLHNIERKLDKNPQLKTKYEEQMSALVNKGYAELAPATKTTNKTWYLPHFAVLNPMKPNKVRIVHDAAAKTKGVSLNDHLLKGPDLLQSLPGVLMRFRQKKIAVSADIKEMFMQVKVKPEDRDALRYLWRGDRRDATPPDEYRMTSLVFGATCSPATAIYVKDYNANKHIERYPDAVRTIIRNHYVDDLLQSFDSEEEAITVSRDVDVIHRAANYELRQWSSNSVEVLNKLAPGATRTNVGLADAESQTERVLGLEWRSSTDDLGFNINLVRLPPGILDKARPTKRETLKILMSLFDPLGLVSPVTIRAKQILQDVWRRGTEWDEPIDEDLAQQWCAWTRHLRSISQLKIPRCYGICGAKTVELHVFVDASETAYAAAAYWRATSADGRVHIALVAAKAKVAPLKLTSIPRLELQAAVLGSRLGAAVRQEHDMEPASATYWTDSKTVMTWLKTGARAYRAYVAHRIAAIEEHTTLPSWRWLPTKLNVADDATRDVPRDFDSAHRWYTGPSFLHEDPATWPAERPPHPGATGEERVNAVSERRATLREATPDPARFSRWERLLRATACVLQFVKKCRAPRRKQSVNNVNYRRKQSVNSERPPVVKHSDKYVRIDTQCIRDAETLLVKVIQSDAYGSPPRDMDKLRKGSLRHLSVDDINNVIVVKTRLNSAVNISDAQRRPAVLCGEHHITRLYIDYVHRRMHHAGVEATLNECRTQYWVTRLRPSVRAVLHRCLECRRRRNVPPQPPTGDLPSCRLAHHQRPFTYTGVDYFGPLIVTVGRGTQKRYGVLFTCLTTRAVHVELAASLTTSSAVMALRRFIARRGCPSEVWSDNGTNLHGAERELRNAIEEATEREASTRKIAWRFIPPGAPFMGGAWERLIRSIKTALNTVLRERHPNEETLTTLLAEAEFTVNNRPLTHVSVDPHDPEALTPNHFLLHGPASNPTPGSFTERDLVGRATWRTAQQLADMFWARWVREYLPELSNRREPHGRGSPISEGDVVLIADNTLPRNTWPLGRVITTYPGPDGVVRVADVRTKGGVLRRPVKKLVILPTSHPHQLN